MLKTERFTLKENDPTRFETLSKSDHDSISLIDYFSIHAPAAIFENRQIINQELISLLKLDGHENEDLLTSDERQIYRLRAMASIAKKYAEYLIDSIYG